MFVVGYDRVFPTASVPPTLIVLGIQHFLHSSHRIFFEQ